MRVLSNSKRAVLLLAAFVAIATMGTDARADNIKRTCNAYYNASVASITFDNGSGERTVGLTYKAIRMSTQKAPFSAEGSCGKLAPNRCRKRARNSLVACTTAHVNSPKQLPQQCRSVKNYVGPNLMSTVKTMVCGSQLATKDGIRIKDFLATPYKVEVLLGVTVRGGDDCGERKPAKVVVEGRRHNVEGNQLFVNKPLKYFSVACP